MPMYIAITPKIQEAPNFVFRPGGIAVRMIYLKFGDTKADANDQDDHDSRGRFEDYKPHNPTISYFASAKHAGPLNATNIKHVALQGSRTGPGNLYANRPFLPGAVQFTPAYTDGRTEWFQVYLHTKEHIDNINKLIQNFSVETFPGGMDNDDVCKFGSTSTNVTYQEDFLTDIGKICELLTTEMADVDYVPPIAGQD